MSLWADKYRPRNTQQLDFHPTITKRLKSLATSGDFPHLLVYGPSGAGKKSRILATLKELYGSSVEKLKVDIKTFVTPSNRKLEFNVISSPYHIEITPSDMGNNDRIVIQDLLKEVAQVESIDFTNLVSHDASHSHQPNKKKFKVVVINEAESMTRDAQAALRRTMEKYSANIRLVLVCNSTSNIIDPIKSRTLSIRVPAPSISDFTVAFDKILSKEQDARRIYPQSEADKLVVYKHIAEASERNLRMGIMMLEALYMNSDKITTTTKMIIPDWELVIDDIASSIIKDRSVTRLSQTRTILYELLAHSIPAKLILKRMTLQLWKQTESIGSFKNLDAVKLDIVNAAALFDERLSLGNKAIFHLEGFVTRVMVILEKDLS
ncbi:unnamed protein product [Ambrosiozyma monospora]|uniref:Unnamed protein product n=1 Tax=Ambrosiozyma monospora TaxID=43982 RepID=A0A9W6YSS9_AMBMO|nr:unnamed protein product [Ambrosiozyma monospora]